MNSIALDITGIFSSAIGEAGLSESVFTETVNALEAYGDTLRRSPLPFMLLPQTRYQFSRMEMLASQVMKQDIRNLVLLGIGGSSLGTDTIYQALLHPFHNTDSRLRGKKPRFFIVDNIDPHKINGIIDAIEGEIDKTLLVAISKSGGTPETISQLMIFKKIMEQTTGFRERIILVTDKEKGILNKIAKEEGYETLNVPDGVGGRFSVLTPVGIFPTLVMGLPAGEMLDGAQSMSIYLNGRKGIDNMAYVLAAMLFHMDKTGKHIHVIMPYCERLSGFADWFRQLEGESLGKGGFGPTPAKSIGVTDQHSQLQLYVDGPKDKCILFLYSAQQNRPIPDTFPYIDDVSYLANKDMKDLFRAEYEGTVLSLKDAGTPHCTLSIDNLNAHTLGGLFYLFEMVIVFLGRLYGVDAFDQPGVEQGKIYTKAIMGQKGLEGKKSYTDALMRAPRRIISFP